MTARWRSWRPLAEQAPSPFGERLAPRLDGGGLAAPSLAGWRSAARSPYGDWFWRFDWRSSGSRPSGDPPPLVSSRAPPAADRGRPRRSTPRRTPAATAARNVTHDDPALGQLRPLGRAGRGSRRRRVSSRPRGAGSRPRSASSSASRAASVRARSCTAGQPADSSTPIAAQRAGDRLGAQRHRVKAPRVLVHPGVQPGVRVGQVGVAAP